MHGDKRTKISGFLEELRKTGECILKAGAFDPFILHGYSGFFCIFTCIRDCDGDIDFDNSMLCGVRVSGALLNILSESFGGIIIHSVRD